MGSVEGDLFNISADLYPQEVKPSKKLENSATRSNFEPKEHFDNWFETEDEPWEFDPCSDKNSDTVISYQMHRANAAYARKEFDHCSDEINRLNDKVPNLKRFASLLLPVVC